MLKTPFRIPKLSPPPWGRPGGGVLFLKTILFRTLKLASYMLVSGGVLCSFASSFVEFDGPERNRRQLAHYTAQAPPDTTKKDTLLKDTLPKPKRGLSFYKRDRYGDPFTDRSARSPLNFGKEPANVKTDIRVDTGGNVTVEEKIGGLDYRPPTTLSYREFSEYADRKLARDYWRSKTEAAGGKSEVTGRRLIPKIYISPVFDRMFGGNFIDFQTNGFVTLDFGVQSQRGREDENDRCLRHQGQFPIRAELQTRLHRLRTRHLAEGGGW